MGIVPFFGPFLITINRDHLGIKMKVSDHRVSSFSIV
jgi:hypothetical protein